MPEKDKTGHAILVGAGPGCPGLFTIEGKYWVSKAAAVLYDRLADEQILAHAPPAAERIFVGKSPGNHAMAQEDINALLVEKAREGKLTVRLKGGDPLVFGRGGEEADALAAAGIPFRIVPGITAASAAAAYAGIPLTDRRHASSVAFVTGHEDPAKAASSLDFTALAGIDTVVFYMGIGRLETLARKMIDAGRAADTPAALVRHASTPRQQTVVATLGTLHEAADRASITPPALIIVGAVAGCARRLGWFEQLPLKGRSVMVTRSRDRNARIAGLLAARGAEVISAPMISVEPLVSFAELDAALRGLGDCDWTVLTSPSGVELVVDRLRQLGLDSRAFAGTALAAVGAGTAAALAAAGLRADLVPPAYTTASLADALVAAGVSGRTVRLLRSDIAPDDLVRRLEEAGATVEAVTAYRTVRAATVPGAIRQRLAAGDIDWVLFTSSSTVEAFAAVAGDGGVPGCRFASIGPMTSAAARERGLTVDAEADPHTIEGLIEAVVQKETGN